MRFSPICSFQRPETLERLQDAGSLLMQLLHLGRSQDTTFEDSVPELQEVARRPSGLKAMAKKLSSACFGIGQPDQFLCSCRGESGLDFCSKLICACTCRESVSKPRTGLLRQDSSCGCSGDTSWVEAGVRYRHRPPQVYVNQCQAVDRPVCL